MSRECRAIAPTVASLALLVAITGFGVQSAGAAGLGYLTPWAFQSENPNANQIHESSAQATTDAKNFNLITAHPIAYSCPTGAPTGCASDVVAMKKANPKLKILMYMTATFGQVGTGPGPSTDYQQCPGQVHAFPSNWYEVDSQGHYITNPKGNCLIDPSQPGWLQNRVSTCKTDAAAAGYDGCYLDTLGAWPLHNDSSSPVHLSGPRVGQTWTTSEWLAATTKLGVGVRNGVRAAVPAMLVYANGLTDGPSFYNLKTSQILAGLDGGIAEAWLHNATLPATTFPGAPGWLQNVKMIGAVEASGKPLLTITKCWNCSDVQGVRWLQYSLASFLMGTQGRSMFSFSPSQSLSRTTYFTLYNTNLGTPAGSMTATTGGAYTRKFARGIVVVDPVTNGVQVSLGGTYYTTAGCGTLPAHDRMVSLSMTGDTGCILTTT